MGLSVSSGASIFSRVAFPPFGNSDLIIVSASTAFHLYSKGDFPFHHIAYYSHADWDGLCDHLRDVPMEDILKFNASAAASEFYKQVYSQIDVYIPHRKNQVNLHSSPWFAAACAATIAHRNHFFHFYQQNKSSESKVKFGKAHAKLAYAKKQKIICSLTKNVTLGTLGKLLVVILIKGNLLCLLYSMSQRR